MFIYELIGRDLFLILLWIPEFASNILCCHNPAPNHFATFSAHILRIASDVSRF